MAGRIVLGDNQYGKAEVRLVRVTRDTERHVIEDLNVTTQLRGDFEACHTMGDNAQVVATDTQKNTVYAFAREHGVGAPETFLLTLARHFVDDFEWVTGGSFSAEQYAWERIAGPRPRLRPHRPRDPHRAGRDRRRRRGRDRRAEGLHGAQDDRLGVPRLPARPLHDPGRRRPTGSWPPASPRPGATPAPGSTTTRRTPACATRFFRMFANHHSLALQQTIFEMGKAVLEQYDEITEISLSCPNKHHFLVDLEPFGLDNPGEVFFAADRPYGLIQATVRREDS